MSDSTEDTLRHIDKVQARLLEVQHRLVQRSVMHDASKLEEPEKSILDAQHVALAQLRYGTPEYAAALATVDMQPFLAHHYAKNSHHPQFYENGIAGMSLLDVIEMVADWRAASERTSQGSIAQSLPINKERFGIDEQLYAILENTVRELGW